MSITGNRLYYFNVSALFRRLAGEVGLASARDRHRPRVARFAAQLRGSHPGRLACGRAGGGTAAAWPVHLSCPRRVGRHLLVPVGHRRQSYQVNPPEPLSSMSPRAREPQQRHTRTSFAQVAQVGYGDRRRHSSGGEPDRGTNLVRLSRPASVPGQTTKRTMLPRVALRKWTRGSEGIRR